MNDVFPFLLKTFIACIFITLFMNWKLLFFLSERFTIGIKPRKVRNKRTPISVTLRKLEMSKLWCTFLANSHQSHFGNNEAISEHCQNVICTAVCGDETFTVHLFRSCPRLSKTWIVNEVMARIDCTRAHFSISRVLNAECRPTSKSACNIDQYF